MNQSTGGGDVGVVKSPYNLVIETANRLLSGDLSVDPEAVLSNIDNLLDTEKLSPAHIVALEARRRDIQVLVANRAQNVA